MRGCVGGGWGDRWLGGLLFFCRSSGSDGRGVIEGVLNLMGLRMRWEGLLGLLRWYFRMEVSAMAAVWLSYYTEREMELI